MLCLAPTVRILDGIQSALNPQGPQAAVIAEITWVLFIGGAFVFALVLATAAYAILARRQHAAKLGGTALIVAGGIVFPLVVLTALLLYTVIRAGALHAEADVMPLRIEVTGEQWWWRVRYLRHDGSVDFETANEIHIPAGRPIDLALRSADVIHSFWVPTLAGKLDMIPGRTTRLRIMAERAGEYRGQCAEYCGGPHGFMAFFVFAQEAEHYEAWAARQRVPAPAATDQSTRRGEQLFLAHCAACHAVRGTPARGERGPDLTHVGNRRTLAAGLLPNNAGTLAGWIASGQRIKPGNLMPAFEAFEGEDLRRLAHYLETLK